MSHPPLNPQSPASFDQVTRLPPENASAPLDRSDAWCPNITVSQVSTNQHRSACQKSQRSTSCNMVKSGLTWSRVFRRRGWLQSPASDGPLCIYMWLMMTSSNGNIFRVTCHLCGGFTGPGEFPTQRPVTRSFDVYFDLRLYKRLCKQSPGWWFETLLCPLWRHNNVLTLQWFTLCIYKRLVILQGPFRAYAGNNWLFKRPARAYI